MSATLVVGPFHVSHNFLLLVLFPQNPLVDFPLWGVFKELTSNLSSFKASHLFQTNFFRLTFLAAFLFVIFLE